MTGFKEIDSPVQMRLYTLTKHQFVLVFVAFTVAFFVSLLIGILGPPAIVEQAKSVKKLSPPVSPKNYKTGPFLLNSGYFTQFNQELWLFWKFHLSGIPFKKGYIFERSFHMVAKVLGSGKDTSYKLINHSFRNRSRTLRCASEGCDTIVVLHLATLHYPSYLVNLTVYGLNLPRSVKIKNIFFTFKCYGDQFTQMEIWFRFAFLVLSFTVTCVFAHSLRRFPVREWSIEQRWMSALLPLLLLYNNPLFPLNFLIQSSVPQILDAIFQGSFFAALMMFWLCAYHGIRQTERKFLTFYLPKVVIVGLIWATGCSLLIWQDLNEMGDPTYQYKVDTGHFMGLKIFFFAIATVYVLYLLFLLIQAFRELRNVPYFGMRLKFLTGLMLIVVLISLVGIFFRFGSTMLQDNFVVDASSNYKNSAEFLAFYGLFNLYLYTMTYVYSPSSNAIRDANFKPMNPSSFTRFGNNGEEDDVLYQRKEANHVMPPLDEYESEAEDEEKKGES